MEQSRVRADDWPVAERIVEYIEQNYANQISLRDVAVAFGYTPSHLTSAFRRSTGMPVTAWIIKRRILAARKLLGQPNVNVAFACDAAGFNDLSYFTRQFERHVGVTPGRFRSVMHDGSIGKQPTVRP
jgi:AraC family transcriptional activator of pobA